MKNTKKILAALCAMSFAFGAASCGSSDSSSSTDTGSAAADESVASTAPAKEMNSEQKEQVASIAEKLETKELANKTLKFFAHWDINPADGAVVPPDIQMFRDKYQGEFEYISTTWENRYTDLAAKVIANESPDLFPAMDMDGFPRGAIKAMFDPIDDVIDLDSDLWKPAKTVNDAFVYGGKHYVAAIQAQPDIVCVYNTRVFEEMGYDDPAELYYNNEWTFSKFSELCKKHTNQEKEIVGLDGWWYANGMQHMSGLPLIGMKDGQIVNNMEEPVVAKVQDLMYELQKNDVCYNLAQNNWKVRNDTYGAGLSSGDTLFYPIGMWGIEDTPENVAPYGDVEAGEVMFVPMPRLDDSDITYVSARDDGYFLIHGAQNKEGFAAYMDCRMLSKTEAADITEQQLRDDYKWNDKMIEMRKTVYELVNEHPVFDFSGSVSQELTDTMNVVRSATISTGGTQTWTQCVEEHKKEVDYLLKDAQKSLEEGKKTAE